MTDDIRQQLEEAWPGEWKPGLSGKKMSLDEHNLTARIWGSEWQWYGCLYVGAAPIPKSRCRGKSEAEAARALRVRAEILVDALERMGVLGDD
jgi:hypothetical protein